MEEKEKNIISNEERRRIITEKQRKKVEKVASDETRQPKEEIKQPKEEVKEEDFYEDLLYFKADEYSKGYFTIDGNVQLINDVRFFLVKTLAETEDEEMKKALSAAILNNEMLYP